MSRLPRSYKDNKVCIMGLGYVGLTLAVTMADIGFEVHGVEIKDDILKSLKKGVPHFHEPGLEGTLKKVLLTKNLKLSKKIPKKIDSNVYIITVGTPINYSKKVRTDMIVSVSEEISNFIKEDDLIILRSTVEPGATNKVCKEIFNKRNVNYNIAFCPERTLEGTAMKELRSLPQIIGADNLEVRIRCAQLFSFITPTVVQVSKIETAELIKLVDNCQRDVQFALANEVAQISDLIGVSANEVIKAGKLAYPRTQLPIPGLVGGPCLEKDSYILESGLKNKNFSPKIIMSARKVNEAQPRLVINQLKKLLLKNKDFSKKINIVVAGVAFKGEPETNDLRGTMAKPIIKELETNFPSSNIRIYDPIVTKKEINSVFSKEICRNLKQSFVDTSLYLIVNNHKIFSKLPISNYSNLMKKPGIIFDFWNNFSSQNLLYSNRIRYIGLGEIGLNIMEKN